MSLILNTPHKRKWRLRQLILALLILLLPLLGLYLYGQLRTPGAALTSHNYMDRPIGSFWVNDSWGGNGGVTCCWRLDGPTAKVVWILSMSKAQEDQGMQIERHEIELPMPPRKDGDDTLHVYFFPGNRVELICASTMLSPLHYPDGIPQKAQPHEQGHQP